MTLTALERRIAKLLAYNNLGLHNKEIAIIVGTSEQRVKNIVRQIYQKFDAKDRIHFCLMLNAPLNSPLLQRYHVG